MYWGKQETAISFNIFISGTHFVECMSSFFAASSTGIFYGINKLGKL